MNQRLGLATTMALGASLILAVGASAQMSPHPAHIHAGSCPEPGDVVAPLSDVSFDMNVDGTPSAGAAPVGQASAIPVEASVTTVPLALADIVAGEHAINVHASAEDLGTYIACGDIGGTTVGASDLPTGLGLPIGLGELNDSGASGVAWLQDGGDGTTTVYVFLVPPAGAIATPTAAVTDADAASQTLDVMLADGSVSVSPTTVKAGQPITFAVTNIGYHGHAMVLEKAGDIDVPLESGGVESEIEYMAPGATAELVWTITEPGTYQLACHVPGHFEDGMVTTFEVVE